MTESQWIETALAGGACKAAVIPVSQVVVERSFRDLCEKNECGKYGKSYMCPPAVGEIEPLMARVKSFDRCMIYQIIGTLEDSFDVEGMQEAGITLTRVSQAIGDALRENTRGEILHLSGGGCSLCEECRILSGAPCAFPDRALPSISGFGIDVYNTIKGTLLKYINGQNTVTYFGMVLFHEEDYV